MRNQAVIDQISELIDTTRKVYLSSASYINADYNREISFAKEYKGRQLFELLQNADDESVCGEGKLKIELKGDRLYVSNTGTPFSVDGIQSLMIANNSTKKVRKNMIGNKGLGFRSVLNWSNSVVIATEDFAVEFSKQNSIEFLNSLFSEKPKLRDELIDRQTDKYPIAILSCPKIIEQEVENGYDTTIIINCLNNEIVSSVKTQIEQLRFEELILLPNLSTVEVITENYHKKFNKLKDDNQVLIQEVDGKTNDEISLTAWDIYKKAGTLIDENSAEKEYELILAYNNETPTSGDYLYSYFKTDVRLSFPAIVHGPFELSNNRNQLEKDNEVNRQLINALAELLVETAVKISEKNKVCDYSPIKLLIASEIDLSLKNYNLQERIYEKINDIRILPTIADKYIAFGDLPKYSKLPFYDVLHKNVFSSLLKKCDDNTVAKYLEGRLSFYNYEDFIKLLAEDIEKNDYSIEIKCELMELFRQQFPFKSGFSLGILVDQNGNNIPPKMRAYLPPKDDVTQLPHWVSVRFLNSKMANNLNGNNRGGVRNLASDFAEFGVTEYNFGRVHSEVMTQLKENLTVDRVNDVLNWIFKYYKSQENKGGNLIGDTYIITRVGDVKKANECYFGREYNNELGEKVISTYSDNFIVDYRQILGTEDLNLIIIFFEWLGVSLIPKFTSEFLSYQDMNLYLNSSYKDSDNVQTSDGEMQWSRVRYAVSSVKVESIENIDKILKFAQTDDIIALFILNEKLRNSIYNKHERLASSQIQFKMSYQKAYRTIGNLSMRSYIQFLLASKKWILCEDGNKHLASYCCFENNNLEPLIHIPFIDYKALKDRYGITKKDVDAFLVKIGVAEIFTELPQRVIYDVLLHLPEIDQELRKGRPLYSKMKDNIDSDDIDISEENYNKFLSQGKVIAKINGVKSYTPVREVFYSDNKSFSEEILRNFNMFYFEYRAGVKKVSKLFGVKPLVAVDVKLSNEPELSFLNNEFNQEYLEYCAYILACRMDVKSAQRDREITALKKNKIYICENVDFEFDFNEETKKARLYKYETLIISSNNAAYVCLPGYQGKLSDLKKDINFADAIAELVMIFLNLTSGRELFRELFSKSREDRNYLMRNDKGDEDLSKLDTAKRFLELQYDPKIEFWNAIVELCKLNYTETHSINSVINDIGFDVEKADNINYEDLNSDNNFPIFIELFDGIEKDISDFNEKCSRTIDIRKYWIGEFNKLKYLLKKQYRNYLYSIPEMSAEQFGKLDSNYDSIEINPANSIKVDIKAEFEKVYDVAADTLEIEHYDDVDAILKEKIEACNKDIYKKAVDIYGKAKADLYVLFDMLDGLFTEEKEEIGVPERTGNQDTAQAVRDLHIEYSVNADVVLTKVTESATPKGTHKTAKTYTRATEEAQKRDGMIGEKAVYQMLSDKFGEVKWLSGIAQQLGFINEGNDMLGYDMTYYIDGVQKYVEVKASKDKNLSFNISRNEINFARNHLDNYELYYVSIRDDEAVIIPLENLFVFADGEDLFNNSKFTIENKEYYISAKLVSKKD